MKNFSKYYLSKYKSKILIIVLFSIIMSGCNILVSYILGKSVDLILLKNYNKALIYFLSTLSLVFASSILNIVSHYFRANTIELMFFEIRDEIYDKLLISRIDNLDKFSIGDLSVRANNDIESICNYYSSEFPDYIGVITISIFSLILSFFISWNITLIYILVIIFGTFFMKIISHSIQLKNYDLLKSKSSVSQIFLSIINSMDVIKSFMIENKLSKEYNNTLKKQIKKLYEISAIDSILYFLSQFINIVQLFVIFYFGIILLNSKNITIGNLIIVIILNQYIQRSITQFGRIVSGTQKIKSSENRLNVIMNLESEDYSKENLNQYSEFENILEFKNVDYFFDNADKKILDNISISIKENAKIGIIGSSGSGKTTILKLLFGFYTPNNGQVLYKNNRIDKLNLEIYRNKFTYVDQSASLFHGTIEENIKDANRNLSESEIKKIIKQTELKIEDFCDGIKSEVGNNGKNLSGGQKQKVAIARAIARNSDIFVFDEAFKSIDLVSLKKIRKNLSKLLKNKTVIVISHEINDVLHCEYVYTVNYGKILEFGTPKDLYKNKSFFYDMCKNQGINF